MILPELPPASLRLQIDDAALAANWRALDKLSGGARAGAAIKANAYGLGVGLALPVLLAAGARQFFVAHWSEVPAALAHAAPAQIAVLHGVGNAAEVAFARAAGVRPVLNSLHQIALWQESGGGPCMLMLDSGINRLGLEPQHLGDPLVQGLELELLLSHLASADDVKSQQNGAQLALFAQMAQHFPGVACSLANSAGIALGAAFHFSLTRPGLALYGGVPCEGLAGHIAQVAFPQTSVMQLRNLSAGDRVGYNATFVAPREMRVATVALGYADGILRSWSGGQGALEFGECTLPVLGRVSMDMIVVDASCAQDLREGDWLGFPYQLPEASRIAGLSQYELLTVLGRRFDRKIAAQQLP